MTMNAKVQETNLQLEKNFIHRVEDSASD